MWILLEQETVSGSGITWAICKSAPRSRQPHQHPTTLFFLQAGCPSCRPTNSVKALKVKWYYGIYMPLISTIQFPSDFDYPSHTCKLFEVHACMPNN